MKTRHDAFILLLDHGFGIVTSGVRVQIDSTHKSTNIDTDVHSSSVEHVPPNPSSLS